MSEKSSAITEIELTPGSEISVGTLESDLKHVTPEYKGMLQHIEETLPATNAACDNFYKSLTNDDCDVRYYRFNTNQKY